jgi:DNA polymerase I-like protein with 3'-5' exonuclease and polymerase domains
MAGKDCGRTRKINHIPGMVHEEIILEVPDRLTMEAAVILREAMIEAGKAYLSKVQVEVKVTIGDTWAEKWTNPTPAFVRHSR